MRLVASLSAFLILSFSLGTAFAQPTIWNVANGSWNVAGNWTGGIADENRDAIIVSGTANVDGEWPNPSGGTYTTVGSMRVNETGTVSIASGFNLLSDGRTQGSNEAPGAVNMELSLGATLTGEGDSTHTGPAYLGLSTLSGSGTTTFSGDLAIEPDSDGAGAVTVGRNVVSSGTTTWNTEGTGTTQLDLAVTGSWTNEGTFDRAQGSTSGELELSGGTFTNAAGGTMNVSGSETFAVTGGGTFSNAGALNIDGTTMNVTGVTFESAGTVNLLNSGELNAGSTTLDGGTLAGEGTFTGDAIVQGGGTISPGESPGTLTINGNLTLDASTINIELGGENPGEFDVLNVTGAVTPLNTPTIAFSFFGPYDETVATPGASFEVLTAGSGLLSGAWALDFSQVGGTALWTPDVTDTSVTITFVPEPSSLAFVGFGLVGFAFRRRRA